MSITKIERRYEQAKQTVRKKIICEMENANYFLRQGNNEEYVRECDIVSMLSAMYTYMFDESVIYEKCVYAEYEIIRNKYFDCFKFVTFMRDEQHKERYLIT